LLVNDKTADCNASLEKEELSRNSPRWLYRHKINYVGYPFTREKPACRSSFLKAR